ncbi:MAG: D-alanyl-D-alanine carboxypeptidase [Prevotellaceae bacterium]|nr:D-alanyl-D-alanine carboxypeptidase [Prevotellaceae bacterium]MDO4931384.1 D-alanyl-D-alanine carboxypeptidase [Prevotellaceae bacterium]
MRKIIPAIIITSIFIVSALRTCWSGDDDVSVNNAKTEQPIPIDNALRLRTDSFIAAQKSVGSLGIMLYDITAGQPVYEYNANVPMRPASCLKLLSCIAAMRTVGTGYRYRTRLYLDGNIINDTLRGDVILKTQFDPAFNRDSLSILLGALKQRNIKAVKGRVLLDMAFIEPMNHEQHWIAGDLKTSRMGLIYHGYRKMRIETLYGLMSAAHINVNIDSIRFGRLVPRRAIKIAEISTPLHYAVEKALKNSSNINAETLLYLLGYTADTGGNFRHNGVMALRRFIREELKMNPDKVSHIDDGCGLCPDNRMTPLLLIELLKYAHKHKSIYSEMMQCLPSSGTDGTLHDRMTKPYLQGRIKAKTGTLTREGGISTLAGYFTGADGHLIAFAIMNNECPVMDGRWWQDKICEKAFLPNDNTSNRQARQEYKKAAR